jgi:DNA-binding Xre family transcriptional regulator
MKIKIAETAQKNGVRSAYALQKALDISPTIASRLWKGEFDKIGINTLEKLCLHFKCQPNDFLEYPLTLSGNTQSSKDVERATQLSNTKLRNDTQSSNTQSSNASDNIMTFAAALSELERIGKPKSESSLRRYLQTEKLKGELVGREWEIKKLDFENFIHSDFFKTLK